MESRYKVPYSDLAELNIDGRPGFLLCGDGYSYSQIKRTVEAGWPLVAVLKEGLKDLQYIVFDEPYMEPSCRKNFAAICAMRNMKSGDEFPKFIRVQDLLTKEPYKWSLVRASYQSKTSEERLLDATELFDRYIKVLRRDLPESVDLQSPAFCEYEMEFDKDADFAIDHDGLNAFFNHVVVHYEQKNMRDVCYSSSEAFRERLNEVFERVLSGDDLSLFEGICLPLSVAIALFVFVDRVYRVDLKFVRDQFISYDGVPTEKLRVFSLYGYGDSYHDAERSKPQEAFKIENGILQKYFGSDEKVVIPEGVIKIGFYAFSNCENIRSVYIPDSVVEIGNNAFDGCSGLSDVRLSENLKALDYDVFAGCTNLKNINIPKKLKSISNTAFSLSGPGSLANEDGLIILNRVLCGYYGDSADLVIPDGIKSIGERVFEANPYLRSVYIPDGVELIGKHAFACCENLTRVRFPEGIKKIEAGAFRGCENLEAADIPIGLKTLANDAFRYCKKLKTVQLPERMRSVGDNAFEYCESLTCLHLPDSITYVGRYAFSFCSNLKEVHLPPIMNEIENKIPKNCFYLCQKLETVNIPPVKKICEGAFYRCESLKELTLPNSILEIDKDVFKDPFLPLYPEKGSNFTVLDWLKELTIHAPKGSAGEAFAKKQGISYDNKEPEGMEASDCSNPWMQIYGQYVEQNPQVQFEGSAFVFSGLPVGGDEKEHRTVRAVIERGGFFRTSVSGKTNYLVVDPELAHYGRIEAVLEQRQKGKDIKVILLSDLERILFG